MDLSAKVFAYCERGSDPSFWAEPVNALSNLGFILAAAVAWHELAARPAGEGKLYRYFLVGNVFAIGVGSFLFHTYATAWARNADVAPIGIFMFAYLGFALTRFVRLPPLLILPVFAAFAYAIDRAMHLQCWKDQIGFSLPVPAFEDTHCLNGSVGYMPALALMLAIGGWMAMRRHPATPYVLGGTVIFMLSVTFRTVDHLWCDDVAVAGKAIGTHFLWHIFNSIALFTLLLAAVRHGGKVRVEEPEVAQPAARACTAGPKRRST